MRILYVEDNEANQALVGRVVRAKNHSIVYRDEGEGALELLAVDTTIDLILLDIELAGAISGLDVVTTLRARNDHRPIVAVTAYAMMGDRERILAAGCDQYLPKPLVITDLLTLMEHYEAGDIPLAHLEPHAEPAEPSAESDVPAAAVSEAPPSVATEAAPLPVVAAESVPEAPATPDVPVATVPEPTPQPAVAAVPDVPAAALPEAPAPVVEAVDHPEEKPAAVPVPVQVKVLSAIDEVRPKGTNGDGLA